MAGCKLHIFYRGLKVNQENKWILSSCTGTQEPIQKTKQYITANQCLLHKEIKWVLSSCTGTQEPIQKTKQYITANQCLLHKEIQWLFPCAACEALQRHVKELPKRT